MSMHMKMDICVLHEDGSSYATWVSFQEFFDKQELYSSCLDIKSAIVVLEHSIIQGGCWEEFGSPCWPHRLCYDSSGLAKSFCICMDSSYLNVVVILSTIK